ncbi:unnamed protein product [Natator depressus]
MPFHWPGGQGGLLFRLSPSIFCRRGRLPCSLPLRCRDRERERGAEAARAAVARLQPGTAAAEGGVSSGAGQLLQGRPRGGDAAAAAAKPESPGGISSEPVACGSCTQEEEAFLNREVES